MIHMLCYIMLCYVTYLLITHVLNNSYIGAGRIITGEGGGDSMAH